MGNESKAIEKSKDAILEESIQALRVIYIANQLIEDFDDYEDILQGIINCDRVRQLIGPVDEESTKQ